IIHDEGDLIPRTVFIEADSNTETVTALGSAAITCRANGTNSLTLNTSSAGSTVNVYGTASFPPFGGLTTISQRGSNDVVNVGSNGPVAGTLATINGPLQVYNGPSFSNLNIHDELDGVSRTGYITGNSIAGLSPAPIYTTSNSIRNLTVN